MSPGVGVVEDGVSKRLLLLHGHWAYILGPERIGHETVMSPFPDVVSAQYSADLGAPQGRLR
jgi:hypothetical protein